MRNLMICTAHQFCASDKIKKNEMGGACGEHGRRRVQGFGGETGGKETTGETLT